MYTIITANQEFKVKTFTCYAKQQAKDIIKDHMASENTSSVYVDYTTSKGHNTVFTANRTPEMANFSIGLDTMKLA